MAREHSVYDSERVSDYAPSLVRAHCQEAYHIRNCRTDSCCEISRLHL